MTFLLSLALLLVGFYGLFNRKIKISSKKEIGGRPRVFLSVFYVAMAVVLMGNKINDHFSYLVIVAFVLVTLSVVIFAKGRPVSNALPLNQMNNSRERRLITILLATVLFVATVGIAQVIYEVFQPEHEPIGGGYSKLSGSVYAAGLGGTDCFPFPIAECPTDHKITGADYQTFTYVGGRFAKDKNYVYVARDRIEGADPATFQVLNNSYAKDKHSAYSRQHVIPNADLKTFDVFIKNVSRDERMNSCYTEEYAKDRHAVYYGSAVIEGADPASFSLLKGPIYSPCYAKDKNSLFYGSQKINNADPSSFEYMNEFYSKDRSSVYYTGHYDIDWCINHGGASKVCIITDADSATFKVLDSMQGCGLNCSFDGQDKNHKYREGEIVK